MIKWTFFFDEGSLTKEISPDEDVRIIKALEDPLTKWISINDAKIDFQINLSMVKVVAREIMEEKVIVAAEPEVA